MSEVAPPPPVGPPPPKVPEGWKVQWNEQYSEWFYVNIYTKKSQWEKPTEPVYPPSESAAPPPGAPPPGYTPASSSAGTPAHDIPTDHKINPYESKPTPNLNAAGSSKETDEEIARRLQAEEDARAGSATRGNAQQDYMNTPMPGYQQSNSPYPPQQGGSPFSPPQQNYGQQGSSYPNELPPREQKKGGFLGKLLGKASGSSSSSGYRPQGGGYPQQQQYPQQYPQQYQQQPYYGGPQQYGGYPPQGYGQPGMMGGGYGRPMAGGRKPGGLGVGGAAALGVGGGLLGGAMLANAFDDDDYRDGYQDAMQDQQDYGGGDDFGGGDF